MFFVAFPIERADVFQTKTLAAELGCNSTAVYWENVASFDSGWNF